MFDGHDSLIGRPSGNAQLWREALRFDRQRVITCHIETGWKTMKELARWLDTNGRSLAVDRVATPNDVGSKGLADRLVPKQTPRIGKWLWSRRTTSREQPASSGDLGPGERTMAEQPRRTIASTPIASLRMTGFFGRVDGGSDRGYRQSCRNYRAKGSYGERGEWGTIRMLVERHGDPELGIDIIAASGSIMNR